LAAAGAAHAAFAALRHPKAEVCRAAVAGLPSPPALTWRRSSRRARRGPHDAAARSAARLRHRPLHAGHANWLMDRALRAANAGAALASMASLVALARIAPLGACSSQPGDGG
jgi:hypothetical protein